MVWWVRDTGSAAGRCTACGSLPSYQSGRLEGAGASVWKEERGRKGDRSWVFLCFLINLFFFILGWPGHKENWSGGVRSSSGRHAGVREVEVLWNQRLFFSPQTHKHTCPQPEPEAFHPPLRKVTEGSSCRTPEGTWSGWTCKKEMQSNGKDAVK